MDEQQFEEAFGRLMGQDLSAGTEAFGAALLDRCLSVLGSDAADPDGTDLAADSLSVLRPAGASSSVGTPGAVAAAGDPAGATSRGWSVVAGDSRPVALDDAVLDLIAAAGAPQPCAPSSLGGQDHIGHTIDGPYPG